QQRKTTAGFLAAGLRISALVFRGVRQAGAGAVDENDPQTVPQLSGFFSGGGDGHAQTLEPIQGQPLAGLAIGTCAFVHKASPMQAKERLDLADDFAAGAVGIEDLVEEGKESTAHTIDAIPAVRALVVLGKKARW